LGAILTEQLSLKNLPGSAERLEASLAETAIAVFNGAAIVRTHDVLSTKKCVAVVDALKQTEIFSKK
jgi:dihydropteroate synthase